LAFLNAGDDASIDPIKEVLDKKPFASKCIYKTYDDMKHGFAAARGDWTDPRNKECIEDVLQISTKFFQQHL